MLGWLPGTWYGKGEQVKGKDGNLYECIEGGQSNWGMSGIDEPDWGTDYSLKTCDGTVVWKCVVVGYTEPLPDEPIKVDDNAIEERQV